MQPHETQSKGAESNAGVNLAVAEQEAQIVNREQVFAAALFAKQLQADLGGIKNAMVGDGLRVPQVDMSKVMPSEIYKTFRPAGSPIMSPPVRPAALPSVPTQVFQQPQQLAAQPATLQVNPNTVQADTNQLEFNFNKNTRYEDVIEAIERLEKKIIIISEKIDAIALDKKKLKTDQNENGT